MASTDVKVFSGEKSLEEVAAMDIYDMMLAAIVGFAGLQPTLKAVENGKAIALANKETLVVAGDIVMQQGRRESCASDSRRFRTFCNFSMPGGRNAQSASKK